MKRFKSDWDSPSIDWTLPNWKLGIIMDCSSTRIQQKRRELGKPISPSEGKNWKYQRRYRMYAKENQ